MQEEKIKTRFFIGTPLTSSLKIDLDKSLLWKQSKIDQSAEGRLIEVSRLSKSYIGFYVDKPAITLQDMKEAYTLVESRLRLMCPKCRPIKKAQLFVFAHLFIT